MINRRGACMNMDKIKEISKVILFYLLIIILTFALLKLFVFYIPFLIGFIIAELLEPTIRYVKNKTNLSRKASSILVLAIFFVICISIILIGIIFLVSEATDFLSGLNGYVEIVINKVQELNSILQFKNLNINKDMQVMLEKWTLDFVSEAGNIIKNYLSNFVKLITKLPNFFVYLVITILSTYFISSDKFYILDRMEYHFTKKWIGNIREKVRNIKTTLFSYVKAEIIMVLISFIIVLIGLNILNLMGLNVKYPLLMAVIIGFVDALPILGSGTVIIPWSIMSFLNNDVSLGALLLGLYVITLLAKQFLEPKIVSTKIGIHPIFTLIAMYTGFKFLGLIGLLAGPIILIILKNIFSNSIDKGIANSMIERL